MAIDITINTEIEVPTVTMKTITKGRASFLHLDTDNNQAFLKVSYMDGDTVVQKRYFKVSGMTYYNLIHKDVAGFLDEIVVTNIEQFASAVIATPTMVDGNDVEEIVIQDLAQNIIRQ